MLCSDGLHSMINDEQILQGGHALPGQPGGGGAEAHRRRQRGGRQGQRLRRPAPLHGVAAGVGPRGATWPPSAATRSSTSSAKGPWASSTAPATAPSAAWSPSRCSPRSWAAEEELHQRFQREAEAIGRLSHPNIVTVYDLGEADGPALHGHGAAGGRRPALAHRAAGRRSRWPTACASSSRSARASAYAHSRGRRAPRHQARQHPRHLRRAGEDPRLRPGPRGHPRHHHAPGRDPRARPTTWRPSRPWARPVDRRSDVFSAGAVFYEFLTLEKPFKGKTLHARAVPDHPGGARTPLLTLNPELPDAPGRGRAPACCARTRTSATQSMDEVGRDLQEHPRRPAALAVALGPAPARAAARRGGARARPRPRGPRPRATSRPAASTQAVGGDDGGAGPRPRLRGRGGGRLARAQAARRPGGRRRAPATPPPRQRVAGPAGAGGPGAARDAEARNALAELALIAPDDAAAGRAAARALRPRRTPLTPDPASETASERRGAAAPPDRRRPRRARRRLSPTRAQTVNVSGGGLCFESGPAPARGLARGPAHPGPAALRSHFGGRAVLRGQGRGLPPGAIEGGATYRIGARFLGELEA